MSKVTKLVNKEMERRRITAESGKNLLGVFIGHRMKEPFTGPGMKEPIEFTFKGKIFTAYLKPDEKYDIYMDGLLVAMAVKEEFMKLLL